MPPALSPRSVAAPAALSGRISALPGRVAEVADRRRIAVVTLKGVIGGALRATDLTHQLDKLGKNGHIKAVVLDIDSPGGGATESEAIYLATKRLAKEKPVVAWIRGTGASGSYFIACGATRILAFPSAIVGSIGVISARPILVETLRRVGASMLVTKTGPFKDLGAPWREPTDAERAKEQSLVDAIFVRFTNAVASARELDGKALAAVTSGEVWLATQAQELGLIDGTCEEEQALEEAQRLAGLPHHRTVRIGRRRTLLQRLGVPGAGMGPPSARWIVELEGWLRTPSVRM